MRVLFAISLLLCCAPTLARAQSEPSTASDAIVLPPPPAPSPETSPAPLEVPRCPSGSSWDGTACMRPSTWVWGPVPEYLAGSLILFGATYLVQALSTAVSAAQGEHDVGLTYAATQLSEYRDWGYLPLVGPWAKLVLAPPHVDDYGAALFAFEGLLELGAVVFFVVSLFGRVDEGSTSSLSEVRWRFMPRANGLSFDLTF